MAQYTLLLADNDDDYLETLRDYFWQRGFEVRTAINPQAAKVILEQGGIDLAILDVRLEDNNNKLDISGIRIVKTVALEIPKILMTYWPTYEVGVETSRLPLDGMSRPVSCVSKKEGLSALLSIVRSILKFET